MSNPSNHRGNGSANSSINGFSDQPGQNFSSLSPSGFTSRVDLVNRLNKQLEVIDGP